MKRVMKKKRSRSKKSIIGLFLPLHLCLLLLLNRKTKLKGTRKALIRHPEPSVNIPLITRILSLPPFLYIYKHLCTCAFIRPCDFFFLSLSLAFGALPISYVIGSPLFKDPLCACAFFRVEIVCEYGATPPPICVFSSLLTHDCSTFP